MSNANLQHERITALATELRLLAVPDLYGPIAQTAATRKDASYADFLEDILRSERDARHVRSDASRQTCSSRSWRGVMKKALSC